MARGVSTVLDVGLACLLVTASATLLVTAMPTGATPPAADRVGRALLPSTVTIEVRDQEVQTSIGDILVDAALDGTISPSMRRTVRNRTRVIHARTQIHVAGPAGQRAVRIGPNPPPGVAVDAAIFRLGDPTTVVVRTWSA